MTNSRKGMFFNGSGYADPTAYHGTKPIVREEAEMDKKVHDMSHIMKDLANLLGFEIVERIHFRHKRTGKEFK